ncbi:hypothetical protein Sya03_54890 [Spirilliplanes yamanashiensis]|uniref:Uncharacterized protein n=2 Tax=Spirilliplanes yamanashiensis TaxID=42233 RepID=A0A8J3YEB2_9ACTN|nr:hypothetical protein Sya03_54890 [Spirilliplanes yamanashiensis]
MPVALLLVVISIGLSTLLLPIVVDRTEAVRAAEARDRAGNAAHSGIDSAAGQLRGAADADGDGLLAALPGCRVTGEPGTDAPGYVSRYDVTISYRTAAGASLGCTPATVPATAVLTSTGTATVAGRTVSSRTMTVTYTFRTTAQQVPGGLLRFVPPTPTSPRLCLDAGLTSGEQLRAQVCDPGSPRQTFAYDDQLRLVLTASRTAARPLGLCVDGTGAGTVPQSRPCTSAAPPRQQWIFGTYAMWETAGARGQCMTAVSYSAGSLVDLQDCNADGLWMRQVNEPETATGAGAAGEATRQLVNFSQFGRCLDVTLGEPDYAYMIVWPCKQDPDPARIDWNQRWSQPAVDPATGHGTGRITVQPDGGRPLHCLRSPRSADPGTYVTVVPCPGGVLPDELRWTVYRDTGTYETSFRIRDAAGLCLSPTDPKAADPDLYPLHGHDISKSVVRPCDAGLLQKWNADPYVMAATPLDYRGER